MPAMIRKVVVRSVGVLKAFDTPSAPKFAKLTTIYARNGRGKTTLSSVLRAAAMEPRHLSTDVGPSVRMLAQFKSPWCLITAQ